MANSPNTTNPSRRAMAHTSAVAMMGMATALEAATVDPVFAAIEKHKAASAVLDAACIRADECDNVDPTDAAWIARAAADDEEVTAVTELMDTRPTTIAGLRAYLEYFGRGGILYFDEPTLVLIEGLLESPILTI